jgi:hypothetical protein
VLLVRRAGYFFCEDTVSEHDRDQVLAYCESNFHGHNLDWDFNPFVTDIHESVTEEFLYLLSQYSSRKLSHQEYVFIVISALQRVFTPQLGPPLFGLPCNIFDYMLCWSPASAGPFERREGFPSWFWAGWRGVVAVLHELGPRRCQTGILLVGRPSIFQFWGSTMYVGCLDSDWKTNPDFNGNKSVYRDGDGQLTCHLGPCPSKKSTTTTGSSLATTSN